MPDDPPKSRRAHTEGDGDRALKHRRMTPAKGVGTRIPVEIDPETTPPPSEPPDIFGTQDNDQRFAEIKDYLSELQGGLARVWDSRHNQDRLEFVQKDLATLLASMNEFVIPAVKTTLSRLTNLEQASIDKGKIENTFYGYEWPAFKKTIELIGQNVDRVQKDVDRVERGFETFTKQYEGHRTASEAVIRELKDKDAQQETRLRKLEDFTLEWKVKVMMISTGFSGLVAVLVWLAEHFTK